MTQVAGNGRAAMRAFLWIVLVFAVALALAIVATFALIDHGYLDGTIARGASLRLGRTIRFKALHTHLLSKRPEIRVSGLTIGNPDWLPNSNVAEASAVTIRFRFWSLLEGHVDVPALLVDRPILHLVRLGPGRNNWTISRNKSGPAFAPLLGVGTFAVDRGILDFHDYARHLFVHAAFEDRASTPLPFRMAGAGTLKGGAISFRVLGGALHGSAVGKPYPFVAELVDGRTIVHAQGTSGDAFNLTHYALAIRAQGPNLADIGYLFNLITPNSAPFRLTTNAFSDRQHLRFDALDVLTEASHLTGSLWSDHSTGRHEIGAAFDAQRLARADLDAMLAPIPPRTLASSRSGSVQPGRASPWILSNAPISLRQVRGADFDVHLHVRTVTGFALPLTDVTTHIKLDHEYLDFPTFQAALYSGRLSGSGHVDAHASRPALGAKINLVGANLAAIVPAGSRPMKGRLDMGFNLAGTGNSLHAAAATAAGTLSIHVANADVPRQAGWMLGGDLLRAAGASLGGKNARTPLDCAAAHLRGSGGRLVADRLVLRTPLGTASGNGYVDLATERMLFVLQGRPLHHRLFQVAAPVQIAGRWLKPVVVVLPGRKARALGLRGKIGVLLTPLAGLLPASKSVPPQATCR